MTEKKPQDTLITNRPTIKTSDTDLIAFANRWMKEAKPFHIALKKIQDLNEKYYVGKQTELDKVPTDMSNAVINHIFTGVETAVPIITANPPQFIVEPPADSETSAEYADKIQKILSVQYDNLQIRDKGVSLIRNTIVYRLGVWKVFWNEEINDWDVKSIRPQRIYIPEFGKTVNELPYMIEHVDITYDEYEDLFGTEQLKKLLSARGEQYAENKKVAGTITIWEIWTNELVFWKYGNMIIKKLENPYFDFGGDKKKKIKNHFKTPQKPYLLASIFKLGKSVVGETDLIQQTIPIQDIINVSTRQMVNSANKTGNPTWHVDSEVMTEKEARAKLVNSAGLIIWGSGAANPALIRRDAPPSLPAYIAENKIMAERAFDNVFGTHSTTRGERGQQETLGGRLLLKQADIGRLDLVVREYERIVGELGNWAVQLMGMFYDVERTFKYYGESGLEFVGMSKDIMESGIKVSVKSGTT